MEIQQNRNANNLIRESLETWELTNSALISYLYADNISQKDCFNLFSLIAYKNIELQKSVDFWSNLQYGTTTYLDDKTIMLEVIGKTVNLSSFEHSFIELLLVVNGCALNLAITIDKDYVKGSTTRSLTQFKLSAAYRGARILSYAYDFEKDTIELDNSIDNINELTKLFCAFEVIKNW